MTITLGGITLPDLWIDPDTASESPVRSAMVISRAGTPIVFESGLCFQNLDLIGSEDAAWMEYSVYMAVRALAAVPCAGYELNIDGTIYDARFRNWQGQPVSARPVVPGSVPEAGDYYHNIRIQLIVET